MLVKIKTSTIKNKVSYLRAMLNSVKNDTFTPLSPKKPKVKEMWDRQGFKSQKEYDEAMFKKTLEKYAKNTGFDKTSWYAFKNEQKWLKIVQETSTDLENQRLGEISQPIPDRKHRYKTRYHHR
ncbi:MAG: hypothetical protein Q9M50_03705 [Methylococcales bacterium]|nr:hypothetical protein [Methylococcales bacterium]